MDPDSIGRDAVTTTRQVRTGNGHVRSRRVTGRLLGVGLALVATLTACESSSDRSDRSDRGDRGDADATTSALPTDAALLLEPADDGDTVEQLGTADVTVTWSRIDDGRARPTPGPDGTRALDMPDFTTQAAYPRAALVVRNATDRDALSPGTQDVMWGADFQLDPVSTSHSGPDNGDNLLQRGLWGQSAEYKAEVDLRRASCAVHGTEGTLLVRAEMHAEPGTWYRMRCLRHSDELTVTVREHTSDGWGPETEATVTGPVGSLDFPPSMPVAIGGKISPTGGLIRSATDQFNGSIANPVIRIGTPS
jgi:hypothetical protein